MDNTSLPGPSAWSTAFLPATLVGGAGLLLAALAGFTHQQSAGALLLGLAAVLLIGRSGSAVLLRPRLALVNGGLAIKTMLVRQVYPLGEIERIRLVGYPRWGRRVVNLEIDVDNRLIMFGRWELGTDPRGVADALRAAGIRVEEKFR